MNTIANQFEDLLSPAFGNIDLDEILTAYAKPSAAAILHIKRLAETGGHIDNPELRAIVDEWKTARAAFEAMEQASADATDVRWPLV